MIRRELFTLREVNTLLWQTVSNKYQRWNTSCLSRDHSQVTFTYVSNLLLVCWTPEQLLLAKLTTFSTTLKTTTRDGISPKVTLCRKIASGSETRLNLVFSRTLYKMALISAMIVLDLTLSSLHSKLKLSLSNSLPYSLSFWGVFKNWARLWTITNRQLTVNLDRDN